MSHLCLAFRILPLAFNSLIFTCLSEDLEVHWDSWMYAFMSFIKFVKFLVVITSNILSAPFPTLLLELPFFICQHAWCCDSSVRLCSFFLNCFFCSSGWATSIDLSSSLLILYSACPYKLFILSNEFFILVLLFHFRIPLCSFYNFYLLILY